MRRFWAQDPSAIKRAGGKLTKEQLTGEHHMLRWAAIFLVIAIIAAVLGFAGIAGAAAEIAKFLFFLFIAIFIGSRCPSRPLQNGVIFHSARFSLW
jgi:uncharacterized membrane protein YtjA (UPF0391 family)